MMLILVFVPLLAGLCCLITQRGFRLVPLFSYLLSFAVGAYVLLSGTTREMHLVGQFGIRLLLDPTAAWFVLLNAVVSLGVAWHERYRSRHHYFFILLVLLHACVNACFISTDLFNLYVVIELTTIVAFLLISQGMTTKHLWNALRYIFLSNVGMLFYLLGVLLVYQVCGNFSFEGVVEAPPTARALIVVGLLMKGGVFIPGFWLPQAHAEADAAVSSLLSGVVVTIGLLPLLRLEAVSPDMQYVLRAVGFGSIFAGLVLALFQQDIKRLLACSTISQVGFVLISPVAGALYAFAHGVAKATLFLCAGNLPDRNLIALKEVRINGAHSLPMRIAALSIAGCPLLVGYAAKYMVGAEFTGWSQWVILLASVGTATILSPIIMLPLSKGSGSRIKGWQSPVLMSFALVVAGVFPGSYKWDAIWKSLMVLLVGGLLHHFLLRRLLRLTLPSGWEKLEHVVGLVCITTLLLIAGVYSL